MKPNNNVNITNNITHSQKTQKEKILKYETISIWVAFKTNVNDVYTKVILETRNLKYFYDAIRILYL